MATLFCYKCSSVDATPACDAQYTPQTLTPTRLTVELSCVGGVNAPQSAVVTRFTIVCAAELLRLVTSALRHNDVIVEQVINIDQNSRSQTAMFSFQIVDRIRRQSS